MLKITKIDFVNVFFFICRIVHLTDTMRCRARTAYILTITSFLFILVGWISPFWFGRFYDITRSKKQWGLFYVILCEIGNCTNVARILSSQDVDFGGAESPSKDEKLPYCNIYNTLFYKDDLRATTS